MKATADAFIALADGHPNAAMHLWLESADRIIAKALSEPLRAAAHNNVGIAYLIGSSPREAGDHLAQAEHLWRCSRGRVDVMDVPIAGRSSVFHLRLAMQHQDAFSELKRRRYSSLCDAAHAISTWNAQLAGIATDVEGCTFDTDRSIVGVLTAAFGPECPESRLVREPSAIPSDAVSAAYRGKAERLAAGAARTYLHGGDFAAEVECAALLTALLHPSLLPMPAGVR